MKKDIKGWLVRMAWGLTSIRVAVKAGGSPLETIGQIELTEEEPEEPEEGKEAVAPVRDVDSIETEIRGMLSDGPEDPEIVKLTAYSGNKVVKTLQDTRPKEEKTGSSEPMAIVARALASLADSNVRMMDAGSHALKAQGEAFGTVLERLGISQEKEEDAREVAHAVKEEALFNQLEQLMSGMESEPGLLDKVTNFIDGIFAKTQKGPDLETPEGAAAWVNMNSGRLKKHMQDSRFQEAVAHLWPEDPPDGDPTP